MLPVIDLDYPFLSAKISKFIQNQCFDQNILTAPRRSGDNVGPGMTLFVMPGLIRHLLLLQRLGRVRPGSAKGLPEDRGEGDRKGRHRS